MVVFDGLRGSVLAQTQQDHIEDKKQQTSNANTSRHSIKILDPYTASSCLVGLIGFPIIGIRKMEIKAYYDQIISHTGGETIFRRSADFHNSPGCNKNRG
ncbi:hypothetical protein [Oryza sativa Japonica Group]|uniref:Uncharacterized protein n=1 Tax=Oryza sativa subsp. japonica TaxID=39947 RepID=Q8RZH5_ORYSJ|nr:hypothetical protein [Oryza sativa Japonica Group]